MSNADIKNNKIVALPQELIDKKELSKRLKVCARTVELQSNQKIIPVIRVGSSVRYSWPEVLAALKAHQEHQDTETDDQSAA